MQVVRHSAKVRRATWCRYRVQSKFADYFCQLWVAVRYVGKGLGKALYLIAIVHNDADKVSVSQKLKGLLGKIHFRGNSLSWLLGFHLVYELLESLCIRLRCRVCVHASHDCRKSVNQWTKFSWVWWPTHFHASILVFGLGTLVLQYQITKLDDNASIVSIDQELSLG